MTDYPTPPAADHRLQEPVPAARAYNPHRPRPGQTQKLRKNNRPGGHLTARGGRGAGACSTSVGDFAPSGQRPANQPHAKYPREETRPARGRAQLKSRGRHGPVFMGQFCR